MYLNHWWHDDDVVLFFVSLEKYSATCWECVICLCVSLCMAHTTFQYLKYKKKISRKMMRDESSTMWSPCVSRTLENNLRNFAWKYCSRPRYLIHMHTHTVLISLFKKWFKLFYLFNFGIFFYLLVLEKYHNFF